MNQQGFLVPNCFIFLTIHVSAGGQPQFAGERVSGVNFSENLQCAIYLFSARPSLDFHQKIRKASNENRRTPRAEPASPRAWGDDDN